MPKKAKSEGPTKAEVKAYYEEHGWKATISKFRIAPKNLTVFLGKSKAKKKASKKTAKKKTANKKAAKKTAKKTTKKVAKKTANAEPPKKRGRKPNPMRLIARIEEDLVKLKGILDAA